MKRALFICSANYYRSRFAEHLFNRLARLRNLPWCADSRGLLVGHWGDIGPISCYTIDRLKLCGVTVDDHRDPLPLTLEDLATSDLVVAVKEVEHRPLMAAKFPGWADRIEYWHIDDLDCAGPEDALPELEAHVRALVERLTLSEAA
ncbi:MAG: low molecular weight phosphatase family protein [Pirellulales bacterium]|nr:low molecular weight phosphatase family protein [Pirellulales bacterium]